MRNSSSIDPAYLVKLKRAGFSDEAIASRCGVPLKKVKEGLEELKKIGEALNGNGYQDLAALHVFSCLQFQEIGKTLGRLGFAIGNHMDPSELAIILEQSKTESDPVAFILGKCIVLRPYVPDEVDKQMELYVSQHQEKARATESGSQAN